MPLITGTACAVLAILFMGTGVLLVPLSVGLSVLAARRGANSRSTVFLLGVALNVIMTVLFLVTVAMVIYESV